MNFFGIGNSQGWLCHTWTDKVGGLLGSGRYFGEG